MNEYKTSNQKVATYCVYAGLVLMTVELVGEKSLMFTLYDPDGIGPQLDRDFYSGATITSPKELLEVADEIRGEVRRMYRANNL